MEETKQTKAELAKAKKAERNRLAYQANKEKIAKEYQENKYEIAEKNADRKEEIAEANKKRYDKESEELHRLCLLKNAGDEAAKDLYYDIKEKRRANYSNYYFEHSDEIYERKQNNKDKPKRSYDKTRMKKIIEEEKARVHERAISKKTQKLREEYLKNAQLEAIKKLKEEKERKAQQEEEERHSKKDTPAEYEELIKERPNDNIILYAPFLAMSKETPRGCAQLCTPICEPICDNIFLLITEKDLKKEIPKPTVKKTIKIIRKNKELA